MLPSKEELRRALDFIGQTPDEKVINKCLELCTKYNILVEDFVDQWSAFTITNLKNGPITLDGILLMERKELAKLNDLNSSIAKSDIVPGTPQQPKKKKEIENVEVNGGDKIVFEPKSNNKVENEFEEKILMQSYSERSDSGQILLTHGPDLTETFTQTNQKTTVKILSDSIWYNPEKFRFLHATQVKIADVFNETIDSLTNSILTKSNLNKNDENTICCGRITSEDINKLNLNTVKLESSFNNKGAKTSLINISQTKSFSLFPGQIVAVDGLPGKGNKFIAKTFYTKANLEFSRNERDLGEDYLQIVVAVGPYTTADNFLYEPLQDLLKYVVEIKPNILILLGPFLDFSHSQMINMTETFQSYFDNLIQTIMECFNFEIKVVLVPSDKDANHFPIFPTPSYDIKEKYPNLICAPNPCLLDINGIVIGTSSMDILFHLSKEEIARKPNNTDRMARLASHLIEQKSFYPLYPNDNDSTIDYTSLLKNCEMKVKPNILITPSILRYCIKDLGGCLFVNPERLVKNYVGGTFAVINVNSNDISCQIRKI
ncbi:DNA polymerase alpha subunit B [Onthophagus taurus]|uniref:DNA polymerase alpha subunit B n=1 Tax=Onthophagus taurus TaxID=166361 RepID=UPI0039BE2744